MEEDPFNEMITQMVIEDEDEEDDLEFQMVMGQSSSLVGNIDEGSSSTRQYKDRGRKAGYRQLMKDYFDPRPIYNEEEFRTRFRMSRSLFERILRDVANSEPYFRQEHDAFGREGFSPYQKITAAVRQLAYGEAADRGDEYLRMSKSTAMISLKKFCQVVRKIYSSQYLRAPNSADIDRLLRKGNQRGFPGMLGSLDCMHWEWKNCPSAFAGQYSGRKRRPTIILEAVASYDTWIWHAFFGTVGSHNDINVLGASPLFDHLERGQAPACEYVVNGNRYTMGYYLADGIYPSWTTLVKTISRPGSAKAKLFATKQEAYRKDVERAFGVIQARWGIIMRPARLHDIRDVTDIMMACIILHNMIVEEERDDDIDVESSDEEDEDPRSSRRVRARKYDVNPNIDLQFEQGGNIVAQHLARYRMVRSNVIHTALQADLVNHVWTLEGDAH